MIVLSNSTEQTLLVGQSVTFDLTKLKCGNAECHRQGTSSVKLRCPGIYRVAFGGNIGGTVAGTPVQLAIAIGGDPLLETTMISTPAAVGDLNSVYRAALVKNCCCDYDRITVVNTGTSDVVVGANAELVIAHCD
mgnify:CR=1 FL=1